MKRLERKFEKKDFTRSPSEKHSRSQCWEYRKGNCTAPTCSEFGKKCAVRHQQTEEQSSQKPKQKVTEIYVAKLNIHDNWVEYFRTASRRSLQGVYGRAPVLRPIKRATIHKSYTCPFSSSICPVLRAKILSPYDYIFRDMDHKYQVRAPVSVNCPRNAGPCFCTLVVS